LLPLFSKYLLAQGIPDTDEEIRSLARAWAYQDWTVRLKEYLDRDESAMML